MKIMLFLPSTASASIRCLLVTGLLLTSFFLQAQPKPKAKEKTPPKEKAPTQKELEEMMKEAENMMGEMSEEDRRMMDSMGIKMPSMKNIPKVSDLQLASAWEDENRVVPRKNTAKIAAIAGPVSNSAMGVFMIAVQQKTVPLLKKEAGNAGEKIYKALQNAGYNSTIIGNSAAMLWAMGRIEVAYYIMAKICSTDPANTDNISNYASMLTMMGAEQLAIPILNNLNARFPKNSTLLNNLGQAWFGLGDIAKAEKYFDSTLRLYPLHPQANYSKSAIEESKGNTAAAIAALKKSISKAYSKEKEEKLRKLGQPLKPSDFTVPGYKKADPLNLGGFATPPFPRSVAECIANETIWKDFRNQIDQEIAALKKRSDELSIVANKAQEARMQADILLVKTAINNPGTTGRFVSVPLFAERAGKKLNEQAQLYAQKMERFSQKSTAYLAGEYLQKNVEYEKEMEILREENLEQTGEGKANKDYCPKYRDASDKLLRTVNPKLEELFREYLQIQKDYINEEAYWSLYIQWPEAFEVHKILLKTNWLNALKATIPKSFVSITEFNCSNPPAGKIGKLQRFDDVACKYHSKFVTPVGTLSMDCSNWTTTLDLQVAKITLKQDMDKTSFGDQFVNCRVEIGPKLGREAQMGPIKVEASVGASVGVEFDRNGITDVTMGVGAEAEASVAGPDMSAKAGMESKISLVTGKTSTEGSGIFQLLNK